MAGLADIILATDPMKGLEQGLQSGEQLGGSAQNAYSKMINDRAQQQKMKQGAAAAPFQQRLLQAQAGIAQQKAQDQQAMDQATLHHLLSGGAGSSNFTVAVNAVTGDLQMYDKSTGKWVTPGQESTVVAQGAQGVQGTPSQGSVQVMPAAPLTQPSATSVPGPLPLPTQLPPGAQLPSDIQADQDAPIYQKGSLPTRYSPRELTKLDPKTGEVTPFYSPTRTAVSQAEVREMGLGGIHALRDDIVNAIAPYQGALGRGRTAVQRDIAEYKTTSDPAKKAALADKLTNFYSIANSRNELASTLARATTGAAPGEATLNQQAKQVLNQTPPIPIDFPQDLFAQGDKKMFDLTSKLGKSEVLALARATDPGMPAPSKSETGAVKITIPDFNTKTQFNNWLNALPLSERRQAKVQLGF